MKSIIIAATISAVALVGCTSQAAPAPAPTVTVTQQAPVPLPAPSLDDGVTINSQKFVDFVRDNGGIYGSIADESDIIELGTTICDGLSSGLSEDQVTAILAQALVKSDMGNDDGAKFGAALIVGAKNYLCGSVY
jgi:PBP1b-binding outer membrane lipoprotein LpoB